MTQTKSLNINHHGDILAKTGVFKTQANANTVVNVYSQYLQC